MTHFDAQYHRQTGRCFWCQLLTPIGEMTRDHLHPRRGGRRARLGNDYVLACQICNQARGALVIGSLRFTKWLRRVMRGDVRRLHHRHRPHRFFHNPT